MTIDEVNALPEGGCIKFVKVGGKYRFCHVMSGHISLVKEDEYPKVEAAGTFNLFQRYWKMVDWSSNTCSNATGRSICSGEKELEELRKMLKVPFKSDYEEY